MSLTEQDLQQIDSVLGTPLNGEDIAGAIAGAIAELRRRLPGLMLMRCDASDVLEEPFCGYPHVDLHLVDSASHCAEVTTDLRRASGLLLARKTVVA